MVVSESMEPLLYRGDLIVVENVDIFGFQEFNPNDIKVGDIVVYNSEWFSGGKIIHRVIAINETNGEKTLTIKGDHNPVHDSLPVKPEQIVSIAITIGNHQIIVPKIGYVSIYLQNFFRTLIGLPPV